MVPVRKSQPSTALVDDALFCAESFEGKGAMRVKFRSLRSSKSFPNLRQKPNMLVSGVGGDMGKRLATTKNEAVLMRGCRKDWD